MATAIPRWFLIGGFLALLALPVLDMRLHLSARDGAAEKRKLAPPPSLAWDQLDKLPVQFEAYFRDHFGFRAQLIRWYSLAQINVFHRSSVPNVIIGDRGWLYYAGYDDGVDIREFQGNLPLGDGAIEERRLTLEGRAAALGARGIPYMFVIAPNKHSVYPEYLPASIGPRQPGNQLDHFMAVMRARSTLTVLDLRDALRTARADGDVYYRTDTHWNAAGAFVGYRTILDAAHALAPAIHPRAADEFEIAWSVRDGGDLAGMLAMADAIPDREVTYTLRPPASARLPLTVVVIGDSFMNGLKSYLKNTFARVRLFHVVADGGFVLDRILAEKPDLVIDERNERYLMSW